MGSTVTSDFHIWFYVEEVLALSLVYSPIHGKSRVQEWSLVSYLLFLQIYSLLFIFLHLVSIPFILVGQRGKGRNRLMEVFTFLMLSWVHLSFFWIYQLFKTFMGCFEFSSQNPTCVLGISYLWLSWWGSCFLFWLIVCTSLCNLWISSNSYSIFLSSVN